MSNLIYVIRVLRRTKPTASMRVHYLNGMVRDLPPAAADVVPSERTRAEAAVARAEDVCAPLLCAPAPVAPPLPPYSPVPAPPPGARADGAIAAAGSAFRGTLRNGVPPEPPLATCFVQWASTRANRPPASYKCESTVNLQQNTLYKKYSIIILSSMLLYGMLHLLTRSTVV